MSKIQSNNRGMFHNRTQGKTFQAFRERVFIQNWEKENKNFEILQSLFTDTTDLFLPKTLKRITNRERMIVATVIQWLGSNVGWSYLTESLKEMGYKLIHSVEYNCLCEDCDCVMPDENKCDGCCDFIPEFREELCLQCWKNSFCDVTTNPELYPRSDKETNND